VFKELKMRADALPDLGTTPRREFLYSDDMADACVFLMNLPDEKYTTLLACDRNDGLPPLINIGTPRKLLDVSRFHALGWRAGTDLKAGLASAYADFRQ
jgi:GDP-L-fucose synthase